MQSMYLDKTFCKPLQNPFLQVFASISCWTAAEGVGRAKNLHSALQTEYVYSYSCLLTTKAYFFVTLMRKTVE